MIDFVELASSVENYIFIVFSFAELASSVVIEVNHVGFIKLFILIYLILTYYVRPQQNLLKGEPGLNPLSDLKFRAYVPHLS